MERHYFKLLLLSLIAFLPLLHTSAQIAAEKERAMHRMAIDYIEKYKDFAIEEMHRTGIPASITLAQGMHESNYGQSRLARLANNHFGAKCHNSWKGPFIKHDDDAPKEKFRKYESVLQSFKDHSKILEKKRYKFLFDLEPHDYKAWCHGLKKAGYATDPSYAFKLIKKIERYSLFVYDRDDYPQYGQLLMPKMEHSFVLASLSSNHFTGTIPQPVVDNVPVKIPKVTSHKYNVLPRYKIQKRNGAKLLRFSTNVYPVQIAEMYNLPLEKVLQLNDMEEHEAIPAFTNIFLTERKAKADREFKMHKVMVGQNLVDIAKKYAVDLKALKQYNSIQEGKEPVPGEFVALRKENTQSVKTYTPSSKKQPKYQNQPKEEKKTFLVETEEEFRPIPSPKKASAVVSQPLEAVVQLEQTSVKTKTISNSVKSLTAQSNPVKEKKQDFRKQNKPQFHYIEAGETLYSLSKMYHISVEDLKLLNNMKSNFIQQNTVIRVK